MQHIRGAHHLDVRRLLRRRLGRGRALHQPRRPPRGVGLWIAGPGQHCTGLGSLCRARNGLTLQMISLLVRSPADLTSALSQLADAGPCAGRCVITMAAAIGASLGALPPSALPPARKLLAAGYCACVMACGGLIVRIQTGDERQSSFQLLHAPFPRVFPSHHPSPPRRSARHPRRGGRWGLHAGGGTRLCYHV